MNRYVAVAVVGLLSVCLMPAAVAETEPSQKKLIEYGWDVPSPTFVAEHIREMEERPFDGLIMQVPNIGSIFVNKKWDEAEVVGEFRALQQIRWRKFTDNFICMYSASTMDWFSDPDWECVLHNVGLCAKAAKVGNLKGLCFDLEPYGDNPWLYSRQPRAKERSFEEYQAIVRRRGAQMMAEIQKYLPAPVIHTFFLLTYISKAGNLADHEYGLVPAFLNGMLDAAAPGAVITDGNEPSYYYTKAEQFTDACRAIHAAAQSDLVAPENREKYRAHVQCAQALYVDHVYGRQGESPINAGSQAGSGAGEQARDKWFEHNVYWALTTSDRYVWLYSERMDWWHNRDLPPGIVKSVVSAREKVAAGQPLGYDLAGIANRALIKRSASISRLAPGDQPPTIDGQLDDPIWRKATALEPFVPVLASGREAASVQTVAWLTYDQENLYLAVRCEEPNMKALKIVGEKRDDAVWDGDSVDLFVGEKPGVPYYHIILNPANIRWDARYAATEDTSWNPECRSATHLGPGSWTIELALPWAAMNILVPHDGTRLFGNLCRQRINVPELSSWSQDLSLFVEPEHFGQWVF